MKPFDYFLITLLTILINISCEDSEQIQEKDIIYEISTDDIYFKKNHSKLSIPDSIMFNKESLENFLDTNKYTGFNDYGYHIYRNIFNCEESDSIVENFILNERMALYAFYYLVYEGCELDEKRAIDIIKLFTKSNQILKFGVGENTWIEFYLYEDAARTVYHNVNFTFNENQIKFLDSLLID